MPILDLVTIFFSAPLIAVALSAIFLKESVTARHWTAVFVGFIGALVMIRPDSHGLDQGIALVAFGAAVLYAGSIVITRVLGETQSGVTTGYYTMIMYAALAGLGLAAMQAITPMMSASPGDIPNWVMPSITDLTLLLVAGAAVCAGFLLLAHAYRLAPVSFLAPWEY